MRSRYFIFGLILVIGNCSVALPPITLTGTKTATEKQIIGEQTELEKDVWMISSARTATEVDLSDGLGGKTSGNTTEKENSYIYHAFMILDVFAPELQELKSDAVVGENNQGFISSLLNVSDVTLPEDIRAKYDSALKDDRAKGQPYRSLLETVRQINLAREYMVEGYIVSEKRLNEQYNPDKKELFRWQRDRYHSAALPGEYIQLDDGKWIQK